MPTKFIFGVQKDNDSFKCSSFHIAAFILKNVYPVPISILNANTK